MIASEQNAETRVLFDTKVEKRVFLFRSQKTFYTATQSKSSLKLGDADVISALATDIGFEAN